MILTKQHSKQGVIEYANSIGFKHERLYEPDIHELFENGVIDSTQANKLLKALFFSCKKYVYKFLNHKQDVKYSCYEDYGYTSKEEICLFDESDLDIEYQQALAFLNN
jgi:hypothetical protein